MSSCADCGGTGRIVLFTSTQPCGCTQKDLSGDRVYSGFRCQFEEPKTDDAKKVLTVREAVTRSVRAASEKRQDLVRYIGMDESKVIHGQGFTYYDGILIVPPFMQKHRQTQFCFGVHRPEGILVGHKFFVPTPTTPLFRVEVRVIRPIEKVCTWSATCEYTGRVRKESLPEWPPEKDLERVMRRKESIK